MPSPSTAGGATHGAICRAKAGKGALPGRTSCRLPSRVYDSNPFKEHTIEDGDAQRYDELRREAARYVSSWWREDGSVIRRCHRDSRLQRELELSDLVTTRDVYFQGGVWDGVRARLHEKIVDQQLPAPAADAAGPRHAFVLVGAPGAGKSTVLTRMVVAYRRAHGLGDRPCATVSSDEVRARLPEYAAGLGSTVVHPEASYITYQLLYPRALAQPVDLVIDSIGRPLYVRRWLTELSTLGVQVHLMVVEAAPALLVERVRERAARSGRFVPTDDVVEASTVARQVIDLASTEGWPMASMVAVDNSGPGGTAPRVIAEGSSWGEAGQLVTYW